MFAGLETFFDNVIGFVRVFRVTDFVDILLVAVMIYFVMMALRGTRALQLLKGVVIALGAYCVSWVFGLDTMNYIFRNVFQIALIAIVIIFQPELRNLLERVGRLKLVHFLGFALDISDSDETAKVIDDIASAAEDMSSTKTGALIVVERETRLGEYMASGTMLEAKVSQELLKNIFVPNTPLHDGAVIIRDDRIITAGCVLPLTANTNLSSELGTRHRAALGLSETSDAVIVVVSEETGKISVAVNGSLMRNLNRSSLKRALTKLITSERYNKEAARIFRRRRES